MNSAQICDLLSAEYGTVDACELHAIPTERLVPKEEREYQITRFERRMFKMSDGRPLAIAFEELLQKIWDTFKEVVRAVKLHDIWTAYQVKFAPRHVLSPRQRALKAKGLAPLLASYRRTFGHATVPAYRPLRRSGVSR